MRKKGCIALIQNLKWNPIIVDAVFPTHTLDPCILRPKYIWWPVLHLFRLFYICVYICQRGKCHLWLIKLVYNLPSLFPSRMSISHALQWERGSLVLHPSCKHTDCDAAYLMSAYWPPLTCKCTSLLQCQCQVPQHVAHLLLWQQSQMKKNEMLCFLDDFIKHTADE